MAPKLSILAFLAAIAHTVSAGAGIHLANCQDLGSNKFEKSLVVYCPDDSNCNHYPSGGNLCTTGGAPQKWEGNSPSCTFSTGVTFKWALNSGAQSQALYSNVGSGTNGNTGFTCFKDDQHAMFTQNGVTCRSIYYCV